MLKSFTYYIALILLLISSKANSQQPFHEKLLPHDFTIQYAGGIGMFSAGINYPMANNKLDLSFLYGFVPKTYGGRLDKITTKFQYYPFKISLTDQISLRPINPVFLLSFTLNPGFYLLWPRSQYDSGYYWWNSAMRWHLGLSSEIRIHSFNRTIFEYLAIYVEANVQDLYLFARVDNPNYLNFYDVLYIGTGIRFGLKGRQ